MDLRQMRHFVALAELGSFSRAAEKLALTQPGLTRSIKTLEEEVGAQLLDRRSSGAVLTKSGEALFDHARYMITENERAIGHIKLIAQGISSELKVAICPFQSSKVFHGASSEFLKLHENVSFTILELHLDKAVQQLLDGKIDLIFATVPAITMQSGLLYERLTSSRFSIYAAPDHPLSRSDGITRADLMGWRWAMLHCDHTMTFTRQYFAAGDTGLPGYAVMTNTLAAMRSLVVRDGLLGFLPEDFMAGSTAKILRVPETPIVRNAGLISRAGSPIKPLADAFAQRLRAAYLTAATEPMPCNRLQTV